MADNRRRDQDFATDSTLGMEQATPDLVHAQLEAQRAVDSQRDPQRGQTPPFDPLGSTMDHPIAPGGTLDLPISDQVASGSDFDPGKAIGHFIIRARLGEGGMGMVLSGIDADLGRPVAIKVVKTAAADHPGYRERLLREARVMARLEHPNVVRIYEVGTDRGRLFIAMELVDGVTLTTWLKVQRRNWRDIIAMFEQVGRGLGAVHAAGLVHRDFKPDNVLVDRDGRARVADFGLARVDPDRGTLTPDLAASLTRTGMLVGTPAYMAPEQHFGGDVDARADQYSFCIALREALFGGQRPIKIEDAHWGDVPRPLRAVITRGASVDAAERFATMDELLDAITRATSRRTLYIAGAAAAVLAAGGIAAAVVLSSSPSTIASTTPTKTSTPTASSTPTPAPTTTSPITASPTTTSTPTTTTTSTTVSPTTASPTTTSPTVSTTSTTNLQSTAGAGPPPKSDASKSAKSDAPKSAKSDVSKSDATAKPAEKKPPNVTGNNGETLVTEMAPIAPPSEAAKKHNMDGDKPARHEMPTAHRAIVRAALKDFGFGGLTITGNDRDADLKELEGKLAASTDDLEKAAFLYAMGVTERFLDDCSGAAKHWREGKQLASDVTRAPLDSTTAEKRRTQAFRFWGRITIAEGYCELLGGHALGVDEHVLRGLQNLFGVDDKERAEGWLAEGIAQYETGDEKGGKELLILAARHSDKVRAAVEVYAAAVGLKF